MSTPRTLALLLVLALAAPRAEARPRSAEAKPRLALLDVRGWKGSSVRDAIARAVSGSTTLVAKQELTLAARLVDVKSPLGVTKLLATVDATLAVQLAISGRGASSEAALQVFSRDGRRLAKWTGTGPASPSAERAIARAAAAAVREALDRLAVEARAAVADAKPEVHYDSRATNLVRPSLADAWSEPEKKRGWGDPKPATTVQPTAVSVASQVADARDATQVAEPDATQVAERGASQDAERSASQVAERGASQVAQRSAPHVADTRGGAYDAERGATQVAERSAAHVADRGASQVAERGAAYVADRGASQVAERSASQVAERGAAQAAASTEAPAPVARVVPKDEVEDAPVRAAFASTSAGAASGSKRPLGRAILVPKDELVEGPRDARTVTALAGVTMRQRVAAIALDDGRIAKHDSGAFPEVTLFARTQPFSQAKSALNGMFADVEAAFAVGLSSALDADERVGTSALRLAFGTGWCWESGPLSLGGSLGFGLERFALADNDVLGSSSYTFVRPGLVARLAIAGEAFGVEGTAGYRAVLSTGEVGAPFGQLATASGFDVTARVGGTIDADLAISWALQGAWSRYGLAFADRRGVSAGPAALDGSDTSLAGTAVLGIALR